MERNREEVQSMSLLEKKSNLDHKTVFGNESFTRGIATEEALGVLFVDVNVERVKQGAYSKVIDVRTVGVRTVKRNIMVVRRKQVLSKNVMWKFCYQVIEGDILFSVVFSCNLSTWFLLSYEDYNI